MNSSIEADPTLLSTTHTARSRPAFPARAGGLAIMTAVLDSLRLRDLIELLDEVCRHRAVTRNEVCGRTRTKAVARARHELWWRLRLHPEACFSFGEIGRIFHRHHATVLHGVRAHQRRLANRHATT